MGDQSIPLSDGLGLEQPNGKIVKQKKPVVTTCGLGPCQPKCMKPLANIKLFTASLAILMAFYGALATYVVSVLTTIEKAFGFPSSKSGFITSTNDIGFLITVIPVSYMASKAHKPMVIGISGLFIGASGVLSAMPYFIWGGGMEESTLAGDAGFNTTEQLTPQMALLKSRLCTIRNETVYSALNDTNRCEKESSDEVAARSTGAYVTLVIAQVIIGIAASTLWSLGMTFIDDNVKKHVSSIYLGILFSLRTLSPILGFVLGAVFTSKPVDLKPTNLTPLDPQWVGAWWVGFLACGMIIFLAGIPLLFFPRQLPVPKDDPEKRRKKVEKRANKKQKKRPFAESPMTMGSGGGGDEKVDLKGLLIAMKRLLTNRVYALSCCGIILTAFGLIGFFTFLPKYIENQFDLTASQASMILVGSSTAATIGTFSSGFMTSKLHMGMVELARCNSLIGIGTIALRLVFIGLGCSSTPVHGLTGYDEYNFTNSCNQQYNCGTDHYRPVCGRDNITYYSPCHVGCADFMDYFNLTTFHNCTCIPDGSAIKGSCRKGCDMLIPFAAVLFAAALLNGLGMMPGVMLLLRSIEDQDKSLALGFLMFLFSVVGIPAPIVFGSIIDGTCMFHETSARGACLIYDKDPLRTRMLGTSIGMGSFPIFFGLYIWWYLSSKAKKEQKIKDELSKGSVVTFNGTNVCVVLEQQSVV